MWACEQIIISYKLKLHNSLKLKKIETEQCKENVDAWKWNLLLIKVKKTYYNLMFAWKINYI